MIGRVPWVVRLAGAVVLFAFGYYLLRGGWGEWLRGWGVAFGVAGCLWGGFGLLWSGEAGYLPEAKFVVGSDSGSDGGRGWRQWFGRWSLVGVGSLLLLTGWLVMSPRVFNWWFHSAGGVGAQELEQGKGGAVDASGDGSAGAGVAGRGTRAASNWLWRARRAGSLPYELDLKLGDRPHLFLRMASDNEAEWVNAGRAYVTRFVFGRYAQREWWPVESELMRLQARPDGWIDFGSMSGLGEGRAGGGGRGGLGRRISYELFTDPADLEQGAVSELRSLLWLQNLERLRLGGAWWRGEVLLEAGAEEIGGSYLGQSRPLVWTDLIKQGVGRIDHREQVAAAYLARAEGELGKVLAEVAKGVMMDDPGESVVVKTEVTGDELVRRVERVREFFLNEFEYRVRTSNPRRLEPLIWFLTEGRAGHCEYFASAATLLLRELGVASRMVYGYAQGRLLRDTGQLYFRERDAHAWTEVWVPGVGWVVVEVTPAELVSGADDEALDDLVRRQGFDGWDDQGAEALMAEDEAAAGGVASFSGMLGLVAGGGVLWLGLSHGGLSGRLRRRFAADYESLSYREELSRLARVVGVGADRHLTVRQLLGLMAKRGCELDFAAELSEYHYWKSYRGGEPDEEWEAEICVKLRAVRRSWARRVRV